MLEQLSNVCRRRHFSPSTEQAYRFWVKQFVLFHGKRHPRELGPPEVESFPNHLATTRRVAASTQSQALNAIVFLYSCVLEHPLGQMSNLQRVQRRVRVPVVLTREEVKSALTLMSGTSRLMAELVYGAGLRVHECVTLRIKDIDLTSRSISIRNSKGSKDRTTVLPELMTLPLQQHLFRVAALHRDDLARCGSGAYAGRPGEEISVGVGIAGVAVRLSFGNITALGKQWPPGPLAYVGFHDSAGLQAGD